MANAMFSVPAAYNEPNLTYAPGTPERAALRARLQAMLHAPVGRRPGVPVLMQAAVPAGR